MTVGNGYLEVLKTVFDQAGIVFATVSDDEIAIPIPALCAPDDDNFGYRSIEDMVRNSYPTYTDECYFHIKAIKDFQSSALEMAVELPDWMLHDDEDEA